MNEQQLAAVKQALEALEMVVADVKTTPTAYEAHRQAITALQSIISQDALGKMAKNARELGLDYEPAPAQEVCLWAVFCGECRKEWSVPYQHPGKSICAECEAKCKDTPPAQPAPEIEGVKLMQMLGALVQKYSDQLYDGKGAKAANDFELDVAAIRLTVEAQSAPVQPVALPLRETEEMHDAVMSVIYQGVSRTNTDALWQAYRKVLTTTPPAAQPAVQEGRDWSLLEATQESLREHMAEIKRLKAAQPAPVQEPTVEDNSQDWAGMDGATAWHLINRHADGWADVAKMMGEWLAANTPPATVPLTDEQIIEHFKNKVDTGSLLSFADGVRYAEAVRNITATPQPVPVKTYHDGKPWPVAPKPWVGLTADEMLEALTSVDPATQRLPVGFSRFACAIEAKLKGKNHG
jgi:hypothetical protein